MGSTAPQYVFYRMIQALCSDESSFALHFKAKMMDFAVNNEPFNFEPSVGTAKHSEEIVV